MSLWGKKDKDNTCHSCRGAGNLNNKNNICEKVILKHLNR